MADKIISDGNRDKTLGQREHRSLLEEGEGHLSGQIAAAQQDSPAQSSKVVSFFKKAFEFTQGQLQAARNTLPARIKKVYYFCVIFLKESFDFREVAKTLVRGAVMAVGAGICTQLERRSAATTTTTTTYLLPPT